jgi:hypothetical protein
VAGAGEFSAIDPEVFITGSCNGAGEQLFVRAREVGWGWRWVGRWVG